jgi:hypothetical protein
VTTLVKEGVSPEEIAHLVTDSKGNLWWRVDGELDGASFVEQAALQAKADGRTFDPDRWFCGDGNLVRWKGSTYACSNQWGANWSDAVDCLAEAYPRFEMRYAPATEERGSGDRISD